MQTGQVLSSKDIEELHNLLVQRWVDAGHDIASLRDKPELRGAFIENFARSVEAAVLGRIAPETFGGTH